VAVDPLHCVRHHRAVSRLDDAAHVCLLMLKPDCRRLRDDWADLAVRDAPAQGSVYDKPVFWELSETNASRELI
jgi:hypothetical protein